MYQRMLPIVLMMTFVVSIMGCASVQKERASSGPKETEAETVVLGGYLGALTKGQIGQYSYEKKKTKEETMKKYKYQPSRGILLGIENASALPENVKPGQTVEIRMTYAVLGTAPHKELNIAETREIRYKGVLFTKPKVHVSREDGTYTSVIPLTFPSDARKGKYDVTVTVQTARATSSKKTSFYVK